MNMKETIRTMSALLTMMVAMAVFACTFTACSDDDDIENKVTYTYGFAEMSASHPDFLEEMGKIESVFKSALGITGSPFTKQGAVEECDKQVYAACQKAFLSLQDEVWQGDYLFELTNTLTGEVVCMAMFSADNENYVWLPPLGSISMPEFDKAAEDFVKKLYPDFPTPTSDRLICTDFEDESSVYLFLANLIDDPGERVRFTQSGVAASQRLTMFYKRRDVEGLGGFSWLSLRFKEEEGDPQYFITFKNPKQ